MTEQRRDVTRLARRLMRLWFVLATAAFLSTDAFKPVRFVLKPPGSLSPQQIQLECCPLIGGPPFLPLHVQVVVLGGGEEDTGLDDISDNTILRQTKHRFDFIPREATEPQTLAKLLTLQEVKGELRCLSPSSSSSVEVSARSAALIDRAQEFTINYENSNLHILKNNCWTFAWKLLRHLNNESTSSDACK